MANRQVKTPTLRMVVYVDRIDQEFFSAQGSVSRMSQSAARAMKDAAVERIGSKTGNKYSQTYSRGGRRLRNSGSVVRYEAGSTSDWQVRFEHRAAVVHHEGAKSHLIGNEGQFLYNPKQGSYLKSGRFTKSRGGKRKLDTRFRAQGPVDHPGHGPNHYLSDAAREVGLTISQTPGAGFNRRGFARVPRGFI